MHQHIRHPGQLFRHLLPHVLRDLILKALAWQGPRWAQDGWKFAKYFERYLKARRWEDEPLPEVERLPRRAPSRGEATVDNIKSWLAKKARP